jgi:hypothetical protein
MRFMSTSVANCLVFYNAIEYMDYQIVHASNVTNLQAGVNHHISKGWQPIGGAVKIDSGLIQTMIFIQDGGTRRKRRGKKHTRKR